MLPNRQNCKCTAVRVRGNQPAEHWRNQWRCAILSLPSLRPGWRNWQTQRTQNPPRFTPRGGSTPPPGTSLTTYDCGPYWLFWFHGVSARKCLLNPERDVNVMWRVSFQRKWISFPFGSILAARIAGHLAPGQPWPLAPVPSLGAADPDSSPTYPWRGRCPDCPRWRTGETQKLSSTPPPPLRPSRRRARGACSGLRCGANHGSAVLADPPRRMPSTASYTRCSMRVPAGRSSHASQNVILSRSGTNLHSREQRQDQSDRCQKFLVPEPADLNVSPETGQALIPLCVQRCSSAHGKQRRLRPGMSTCKCVR